MSILHNDEAIKESFRRVKDHIALLEKELRADREFIITLNSKIELLNKRVSDLEDKLEKKEDLIEKEFLDKVNKPLLEELDQNGSISEEKTLVRNSDRVSPKETKGFLATPQRHLDTPSTPLRHSGTLHNIDFEELKADLNKTFFSLTNREFKVFSAIYSLEEQNKAPATYQELAQFLDLSSSSIRDYISELIRKGTPIVKEKNRNGMVYVSISKEFRSLNLMSKLLSLRSLSNDQKSLFDPFN
ncbi:HTH domain-containing protein [Candidatus Woesearchaeota archaeon]|nr:HTH domain-containing protein [Candidatus Woesearchaeota archaeon]